MKRPPRSPVEPQAATARSPKHHLRAQMVNEVQLNNKREPMEQTRHNIQNRVGWLVRYGCAPNMFHYRGYAL